MICQRILTKSGDFNKKESIHLIVHEIKIPRDYTNNKEEMNARFEISRK